MRFYILEQAENIQIYSLLFARYLVSWFREWEVRVTDSNLLCFEIWESKSPYAVKYHLLQIALSWKKKLPEPIPGLDLNRKGSDSKRYLYTHCNTRFKLTGTCRCYKSDWWVMLTKGMGIGSDGTYAYSYHPFSFWNLWFLEFELDDR